MIDELGDVFKLLNSESGLEIDLYGTTILYGNHVDVLIKLCEQNIGRIKACDSLRSFLKNSKEKKIDLVIEGN